MADVSTRAARLTRRVWALFLAGPLIWSVHFVGVYLLAEAACAEGGDGIEVLGLPVLSIVTLVATGVAVAMASMSTVAAHREWRTSTGAPRDWIAGSDTNAGLALAGFLLGLMFVVAILFVGLPAAFLEPC